MVMKNPPGSEGGVSELIGSILLIAVLVMAVSIAGIYLFSQPRPDKIPSLHATLWNDTQKIYISHDGGDPLDYAYIKIFVDGIDKTSSFYLSSATGQPWTTWSIGNVLVYVTGSSPVSIIQVVYTGTGSSAVGLATLYVGPGAGGGVAPDPVTASFSGSPTSGFVPFGVQFTDASTGPLVSWLWSFGDGGISTEQNPLHTYSTPSTHTVSLTVSNGSGSSTQTRTNYIAGYLPIIADFTSNTQSGAAPLSVSFTDVSSNTPTSWKWEYRNATVGWTQFDTTQNPSFTFPAGIYSINLTASNAGGSDYETKNNYLTVNPSPPWYCGWSYRKNITIDKSKVPSDQTNFPVLINLSSDGDLSARARSDGYDILFTSSDGTTKLSHEIETYTSGTGALVAWVKVPTLTSSANTSIYMYYGCATATNQQDRTNVWDADFRGVWHLKEDPSGTAPQMLDSTANAWHGTSNGAMTTSDQVAAIVNGGLDLDGSNDYISTNYVQTGVTAYTIEAWIRTSTTSMQSVIVHDRGSGAGRSLTLSIGGTYPGGPGVAGCVGYGVDSDNIYIGRYSTTTVNNNNWHHLVGVWTAPAGTTVAPAQFSIYIDGTAAASTAATVGTAPSSPLTGLDGTLIGRHAPWNTYLPSIIDEVRISNTARNANWILTEYNNQYSPSTFHYVMGQEQWTC
jgi:PKD repeat protein